MPDNAQPICNNAKFIGIAEVSVDIRLLYGRICGGMGRHRSVSGSVRVKGTRKPVTPESI